ncbi:MAG TPA: RDD family protein [Gaiellaceae bacterium]|nr:RDD family protein [Gaiellaceae bacterium]
MTIATPEGVEMRLMLAGAASRFVSATVDILIQVVLLISIAVVFAVTGDSRISAGGYGVAVWAILSFLVIAGYDVLFEVFNSGRTPGKRLNGLRVVLVSGHPVTFVPSAIRNVIRIVDFLPTMYLLGATVILSTRKNQRIGDVVAGTLVVRERAKPTPVATGVRAAATPDTELTRWDVTAVTAEEVGAVRRFLERRAGLPVDRRRELAATFAARLRPKVAGVPDDVQGERFLVLLVEAKSGRR